MFFSHTIMINVPIHWKWKLKEYRPNFALLNIKFIFQLNEAIILHTFLIFVGQLIQQSLVIIFLSCRVNSFLAFDRLSNKILVSLSLLGILLLILEKWNCHFRTSWSSWLTSTHWAKWRVTSRACPSVSMRTPSEGSSSPASPRCRSYQTFSRSFTAGQNKLERLSLARIVSLIFEIGALDTLGYRTI